MNSKEELIDLTKCKRQTLDPKTGEVRMVCSEEIFDKAAKIKPRKVTFELEENE